MKKTNLPKKTTPQIREYEATVKRARKNQHIVKADDGWAVRRGGASRASRVFETKEKATDYGKERAKESGSTIFIHGKDGRIQGSRSYS